MQCYSAAKVEWNDGGHGRGRQHRRSQAAGRRLELDVLLFQLLSGDSFVQERIDRLGRAHSDSLESGSGLTSYHAGYNPGGHPQLGVRRGHHCAFRIPGVQGQRIDRKEVSSGYNFAKPDSAEARYAVEKWGLLI